MEESSGKGEVWPALGAGGALEVFGPSTHSAQRKTGDQDMVPKGKSQNRCLGREEPIRGTVWVEGAPTGPSSALSLAAPLGLPEAEAGGREGVHAKARWREEGKLMVDGCRRT